MGRYTVRNVANRSRNASIDSTYYYIHTSTDFLRDYDHLTADSQSLLPEVGFA